MADPKANNVWVETLGSRLQHGGAALNDVPELLKTLLQEQAWRRFQTRLGDEVQHKRFAEFVTTQPLKGLGASVRLIQKVVDAIEEPSERAQVQSLLDEALQNEPSIHAGNNVPGRPEGNTRNKALRRLRKDAPELHAEVLADRLSANAAMIKAGFRKKTFSVPVAEPERIAATLRRQLDPETVAAVAALLRDER